MTKEEIIEMARQAGFVDYELDDGTTNAFDKRYEAFAKLIAEKAIKEALAQPEQEPVGYVSEGEPDRLIAQKQVHTTVRNFRLFTHDVPLYTTPKREWVGLTAQEAADCWTTSASKTWHNFEAKLKDKNTRGQE